MQTCRISPVSRWICPTAAPCPHREAALNRATDRFDVLRRLFSQASTPAPPKRANTADSMVGVGVQASAWDPGSRSALDGATHGLTQALRDYPSEDELTDGKSDHEEDDNDTDQRRAAPDASLSLVRVAAPPDPSAVAYAPVVPLARTPW